MTLVLVVASASCHSSNQAPNGGRTSPVVSTSGVSPLSYGCPPQAPYAVIGSRYYPPDHPTLLTSTVPPDRCFDSSADAASAGFSLAPPPHGGYLVAGLYLVRASPRFAAVCERAARSLGFAVACPTVVPYGWSPFPASCAPCGGGFVLTQLFFDTPPHYVGLPGGGAHLVIWSLPADAGLSPCVQPKRVGTAAIGPVRGVFFHCEAESEGEDAGHTDLRWSLGRQVYGVSLHGFTGTNRILDLAIARRIKIVQP
jgi:hypothetical protein